MGAAKKRKQKHLGVRVPPEVEELLTALVERMRQEAGPAARVSESSVVLALIILVAAFGISSTLFMMVMKKTRDIAILKSMGATRQSIMQIFIINGLVIGGLGTVGGLGLGLTIARELIKLHGGKLWAESDGLGKGSKFIFTLPM